ncbi:RNA-binding motif protein, X chromosome-like [Pezoporus occidentalis]|uniref:RNA-binding motif protein, X chromosome-like n=1 Tax=Pezoporus occidentalis TaxID=407982 RepID=UPI002F90799F
MDQIKLQFCLGFSLRLNQHPEVPQNMWKAWLGLQTPKIKPRFTTRGDITPPAGGRSRHPPGWRLGASPVAELRAGPLGRRQEPPGGGSRPHSLSPSSRGPPPSSSSATASSPRGSAPAARPLQQRHGPPGRSAIGRRRDPGGDAAL